MNCETGRKRRAMCASETSGGPAASSRERGGERLRLLGGELAFRPRRERRRSKSEEPVALGGAPLGRQPAASFMRRYASEAPRELLRGLLGLELREVGVLLEQPARLQLEQRGNEHEELAAGLEVELLALREPLR